MLLAAPRLARVLFAVAVTAAALLASPLRAQTAQTALGSNRITARIDENSLVTLAGTVHPLAKAANDRGAAADSMQLQRLHLVLKRSPAQEASLRQRIEDLHTPGSARYHQWLTPDQFGAEFGPSDQDIATVESWLASHGFQVSEVKPGKQVIEFSGNVAQLREAFHTSIHSYVVNGEGHYANANDPQIPSALAPVIGGFVSLNNFRIKNYSRKLGQAIFNAKTHTAKPQWTYGNSKGVTFPLAPADFAVQYDLNTLYFANVNGSGQTIAVVNDSNIDPALVNQFRSLFGLSVNSPQVIIDGNDPGIDGVNNPDGPNGDSIEAYIDVEWSGAVAPAATIDLVIAADTALESGLALAAEHAVYENLAPVISVSFGYCEAGMGSGNNFFNTLWEQAAAQGITVSVAAGDDGPAGCDDDQTQYYAVKGLAVSGFASTPYNVAVGGTDFFYSDYYNTTAADTQIEDYWDTTPTQQPQASLFHVVPEQPWNDSQYGLNIGNYYTDVGNSAATTIGAGSGGASSSAVCSTNTYNASGNCTGTLSGYPKPSWQSGTGVPADQVRDLPDVSLFAADGANYSYYPICAQDGDCQQPSGSNLVQITSIGGTSVSAQAFAGIMALVNQKYGRQGQADFVLYPLKMQYSVGFHNVTNGTNSVPCRYSPSSPDCIAVANALTVSDPKYGLALEGQMGIGATADYNAAAGYNLATGLGTIDGANLVTDWGLVSFAATTTTLTPSLTSFTHGTSITLSGSVTGGSGKPAGDVALMTDSTTPLNQGETLFTLSNGTFSGSLNYLPGGTYNVWGRYGGDGTHAASSSTKTQITVNPESSSTYFNILNVATPTTGTVAIHSGATNIEYGTQLIADAEPVPTTYYNQCPNSLRVSGSCSTANFTNPTGTVTFADNGTTVNIAAVNGGGDAEYNAPWSVGSHSVTATYSGDASYNGSSATAIAFSIVRDTPAIAVPSAVAQSTGFTIQVENSANPSGFYVPATAPTGNVTVSGFPSGVPTSAALSAAVDSTTFATEGVATIVIPANTSLGVYTVTVSYAGDANYNAKSLSATVTVTTSGFVLTNSGAITVTEGNSGSSTITVTPLGGFTGSIALSCSVSGSATAVGCSVSPTTANITGTAAVTTKLMITTTSTSGALVNPLRKLFATTGGLGLAMILFIGPGRRRRWWTVLGLLAVIVCVAGIGCGGGSGGGASGSASYTVTVTGTSGSTSASTQVTVTVNQ